MAQHERTELSRRALHFLARFHVVALIDVENITVGGEIRIELVSHFTFSGGFFESSDGAQELGKDKVNLCAARTSPRQFLQLMETRGKLAIKASAQTDQPERGAQKIGIQF